MASIGPQLPPHLTKRKRSSADDDGSGSGSGSDDDAGPAPPPGKMPRRQQAGPRAPASRDEIALDDSNSDTDSDSDSDSNAGPSRPAANRSIGSTLPPQAASSNTNKDEIPLDSGDEEGDETGPSAPAPAPAPARRVLGPSLPPLDPSLNPRRVLGPAPPPQQEEEDAQSESDPDASSSDDYDDDDEPPADNAHAHIPTHQTPNTNNNHDNAEDDSDDSEDYGPAPPASEAFLAVLRADPATTSAFDMPFLDAPGAPDTHTGPPQRDTWMLAPPSGADLGFRSGPDPTQLKARRFASGPRAAAAAGSSSSAGGWGGIGSVWTETAAEKAKRVADAVLGRAADPARSGPAPPPSSSSAHQTGRRRGEEEEKESRIRSYTEATRGRSLYEEHQAAIKEGRRPPPSSAPPPPSVSSSSASAGKKTTAAGGKEREEEEQEEEDDPSKRAFDREKDMGLASRVTHTQRRRLLDQAANFGGRFQRGNYL